MDSEKLYTLAEIRNGTGFDRDILFRVVTGDVTFSAAEWARVVREVEVVEEALTNYADSLRDTARELDADTIHRCHAANRLRKIANEISSESGSEDESESETNTVSADYTYTNPDAGKSVNDKDNDKD
jgi:hypothetical protein